VSEALTGLTGFTGLVDPLDLIEDPHNGNLYVSEWSAKCITLLRPIPKGVSPKVYRQVVDPKPATTTVAHSPAS
jgi:hypothetical protein